MNIRHSVQAILPVIGMLVGASAQAESVDCSPKISKSIARPMSEAQKALHQRQWKQSQAWLDEADKAAGVRSPFDRYTMAQFRAYIDANLKLDRQAVQELEFQLDSPCLPETKRFELLKNLAGLNMGLRNFPKVIEYGNRAADITRDPDVLVTISAAYYQLGDFRSAADDMQESVALASKPTESQLNALKYVCRRAGDQPCVQETLGKLAALYPDPKYSMSLLKVGNDVKAGDDGWKSLFNGKDLDGWTPKIAKHPVGENYADTFRVEDGVIKVYYDRYKKFDRQFGHLFTNQAYSNYVLRLDYKFVGKAVEDSPSWAKLNSGVMIHSQSPLSMTLNQEFPSSLEFQFLATGATAGKQTGNVATPGTNVEMGGKLLLDHIIDAKSKFYPLDEWVSIEAEVHGNKEVIYRVNGTEVLRYQRPQLDPRDEFAQQLLAAGAPLQLSFGHIALQAESQPVWFRNIRIKQLDE